jgi:hypothetical protein
MKELWFLALILFCVEFFLFYWIRRLVKDKDVFYDLTIDQLAQVLRKLKDYQVALFGLVYFSLILLASVVPFLLYFILSYQIISIAFDFFVLQKIKEEE